MITVFTPTYNRAYILENLYKSLLSQTSKNFEWVVVDDGSVDDTASFFNTIKKNDNPFQITYVVQSNGGKHRAVNHGVRLAKGEVFFIVDSDDYLTNDAIEKIENWINSLPQGDKWAGVSGLKGYSLTETVGGEHRGKEGFVDATNLEREKYNLHGDKAEAYFTEVLKKYPFPEFEGENFITEEVVWNAIAYDGYKIRWYNEIIYVCEYLEDGLTKNADEKWKKNSQGTLLWAKNQILYFKHNLKKQMSAIKKYFTIVKDKKTHKEIAKELNVSLLKLKLTLMVSKILKK